METPKILVTVCNYNHAKYLKQSIESIQNQTYENLDICIVDDGSENQDEVRDIISSLDPDKRIRYIFQDNTGKWSALNNSIKTSEAVICTAHDADDVSTRERIELQFKTMQHTNSVHNLCGFFHCWNEEDVLKWNDYMVEDPSSIKIMEPSQITEFVMQGFHHPGINHYFTGAFETAGVSAMFYRQIWQYGFRFLPPKLGIRTMLSEDSDFNFRVTSGTRATSVTCEKLYLYRRNTSTNKELL